MVQQAKTSNNGQADRTLEFQPALFNSVFDQQRVFFQMLNGLLLMSDIAWRENREIQRQMRRDPAIMAPLQQRQYATALADWSIVPEDKSDKTQRDQAEELMNIIMRHLPNRVEFVRTLMESLWYGPSAVNMIYRRVNDVVVPHAWRAIHPDAIAFRDTGQMGVYVGYKYDKGQVDVGEFGRVKWLNTLERRSVILHTYHHEPPDYEEAREGRYIYAGRGLRDMVYFMWMIKQTGLKLWTNYLERYAMGIRVGRFPSGNDQAKDAMEAVLENLIGDVNVLIPSGEEYDFEVFEADGSNSKAFAEQVEWLTGIIKELIIGQRATTEAVSTGLGSSVGDQHAETFSRIIRSDAASVEDSMTRQLVHELHVMNFGDTPYRPRVELSVERSNPEEYIAAVQAVVGMGGKVGQRDVLSTLGIEEPIEGEPTFGGMVEPTMGDRNSLRGAVGGNAGD